VTQAVEGLPCNYEALSSNPALPKKKKKKRKKIINLDPHNIFYGLCTVLHKTFKKHLKNYLHIKLENSQLFCLTNKGET
jgi:hypothetical protein